MPISRIKTTVSPQLYLSAAVALLLFPIGWVLAWVVAVVVHEFFHYVALRFCKVDIINVCLGVGGAKICTGSLGLGQETICALSGPMGSLCLLLVVRWFPYVAFCGLLQAAYNMLPLYPLDGGRVVLCLIRKFTNDQNGLQVYRAVKAIVFALLGIISVIALCYNLGTVPLLFAIILFFKTGLENPLAKKPK